MKSFCNESLVLSIEGHLGQSGYKALSYPFILSFTSVSPINIYTCKRVKLPNAQPAECLFRRNTFCGKALRVIVPGAGVFVPSIPSQRMWENIFRTRRIKPLHHELSTDLLLRECVLWIHLNLKHYLREHEKDTCTDFPPKDAALSEKKMNTSGTSPALFIRLRKQGKY